MKAKLFVAVSGIVSIFVASAPLRADRLEMQNGDRYHGKVLSVSADTVVLESDVLGKVSVPRKHVARLVVGAEVQAPKAVTNLARTSTSTNEPAATPAVASASTNVDMSAALRNLGANTNVIRQIREQMLAGMPAEAAKYDEMVSGLMSGRLSLEDIRREAKSAADQLREVKRELGPEVGDSLDAYLHVLDGFLGESSASSPQAATK